MGAAARTKGAALPRLHRPITNSPFPIIPPRVHNRAAARGVVSKIRLCDSIPATDPVIQLLP